MMGKGLLIVSVSWSFSSVRPSCQYSRRASGQAGKRASGQASKGGRAVEGDGGKLRAGWGKGEWALLVIRGLFPSSHSFCSVLAACCLLLAHWVWVGLKGLTAGMVLRGGGKGRDLPGAKRHVGKGRDRRKGGQTWEGERVDSALFFFPFSFPPPILSHFF
jgi:hypothetical protein